jgi:hypothetical protein
MFGNHRSLGGPIRTKAEFRCFDRQLHHRTVTSSLSPALIDLEVAFGGGEVVVDGGAADVHGVGYFVDGVAEVEDAALAEQAGSTLFVGPGQRAESTADERFHFGNGHLKRTGEMGATCGRWSYAADALAVPIERHVGGPEAVGVNERATEGVHDGAKRPQQFVRTFGDFKGWLHAHPQSGCACGGRCGRQRSKECVNLFGLGFYRRTERTVLGDETGIPHGLNGSEHVRPWPTFSKWFDRELQAQATHHALP